MKRSLDRSPSRSHFPLLSSMAVLAALLLSGCGGGGGGGSGNGNGGNGNAGDGSGSGASGGFPVHYETFSSIFYTEGLPRPGREEAKHMPVYANGTFEDAALFVGLYQEPGVEDLPVAGSRSGTAIRHGRVDNGAGRAALAQYLAEAYGPDNEFDGDGIVDRYVMPPAVRVIGQANSREIDLVVRAVQLVNAALPENAKLRIEAPMAGLSLAEFIDSRGYLTGGSEAIQNTIQIEFVPAEEYRRPSSDARAFGHPEDGYGYVQMNRGAEDHHEENKVIASIIHEITHSLTGFGHVSNPSSIMYREHFARTSLPISHIGVVDREALQALYDRLDAGDDPTAFGPWESMALAIHGNSRHASFGVALRNGHAEPWAQGYRPDSDLADNARLSGAVSWNGTLLGLTPGAHPVAGDAEVRVDLSSLAGRADFTGLEHWGPNRAPGDAGTGTTWLDGDLGYSISVRGNTFRETGGDDGRLTGVFVGGNHEGATGTLDRSDLTAAFGVSR